MIRITSMFSDNYNISTEVSASRTDTWREVLVRIMSPNPPPQQRLCRVYVVNDARASLVEVPTRKWDKTVDGDALLVLHYPKYAHLASDALPQYEDLQQVASVHCRRVALLLLGIYKLRRSALLNINNRNVVNLLARAVWQMHFDLAWMRV